MLFVPWLLLAASAKTTSGNEHLETRTFVPVKAISIAVWANIRPDCISFFMVMIFSLTVGFGIFHFIILPIFSFPEQVV